MNFVEDHANHFFYMGDEAATSSIYKETFVDSKPAIIGIDVETISLKDTTPIGIGISVAPDKSWYFELFPNVSPAVPWSILEDPTITKVGHNLLFDLFAMREYELDDTNIIDTAIISRLLCYQFADLMSMGVVHGMEVHDVKEYIPKGGTMLDVPTPVTARKCMQDSSASLALWYELGDKVDMDYLKVEMEVIPICIEMSHRGLLIDQEYRQQVEDNLQEQTDYYKSLCTDIGFNPGSPQQVAYTLADRGAYKVFNKLPFTRNAKTHRLTGNLSTNVKVLQKMEDPLAPIVLEYRTYSKLLSTYIKPWSHDQRAYTRFHMDAITGRPSSTDRNMQNIPGPYRKDGSPYPCNCRGVLLPDSGIWTDADWEQLELRCLAYLSGDYEMNHIFSLPKFNPDGTKNIEADIHQQVSTFMNVDRKLGKTINFAMTYGATDETLMEQSGSKNINRVRDLRNMWGKKFPQAIDWIDSRQEDALRTGYAETIFHRRIRLPSLDEESADGIKRKAIDYPCQGSAAEILKRGLIIMKDKNMSLQVHDELLLDGLVYKWEFEPLEHIAPFYTPMEISYKERWG